MKRNWKKICSLFLILTLLVVTAAGCSDGGTDAGEDTGPASQEDSTADAGGDETPAEANTDISGTLTYLSWQNETTLKPILDGFAEKYPDVTVDFIYAPPVQDYIEKFQILYTSNDLPDVFVTAAENKVQVLDNNIALDISYLEAFDRLSDKNRETYSRDGKVYAFAPDAWIAGIFYNKTILADNGIDVPTNRTEYLAAMQTLKDNGVTPWGFSSTNLYDPIQGYVATETISKDGDYDEKVNNDELTYADGWTDPINLWAEDYLNAGMINADALGLTGDQVNEMFAFEECAFIIGATWSVATLDELNPDLDYGMLPWFGTDDSTAWMTGAAGVGWSINAEAKNMDAAKAFLEYISSDEALYSLWEETGGLLAVEGIDFDIHPTIAEGYPYLLEGNYYLPAVEWKHSDALGKEMLVGTQEILAGNMAVEDLVVNMVNKHNELNAE